MQRIHFFGPILRQQMQGWIQVISVFQAWQCEQAQEAYTFPHKHLHSSISSSSEYDYNLDAAKKLVWKYQSSSAVE